MYINRRFRLKSIISFVTSISLIFTLMVAETPVVSADDEKITYGYIYYNEKLELKIDTSANAKIVYNTAGTTNSSTEPDELPTIVPYDILGITKQEIDSDSVDSFNSAAKYLLYNALIGNYGSEYDPLTFTFTKAFTSTQLLSLIACVNTYFPHRFALAYEVVTTSEDVTYSFVFEINTAEIKSERDMAFNFLSYSIRPANLPTERDKVKAINDWLITECKYTTESPAGGYAYNVFNNGTVSTAGYADAFSLFCHYAGINAYSITGKANSPAAPHRWNIVLNADEKTKFLVDVAMNDPNYNGSSSNVSTDIYLWQSDLTTASIGALVPRTWDKAVDAFITYLNNSDVSDADTIGSINICNGLQNLSEGNSELVLWYGGGKSTSPFGGIATTHSVQLAAYEDFNGMIYDYAKSKSRAWAVTLSEESKPAFNGKTYLTDKSVINVNGGKVTAVSPGTAYLWYIQKDQTGTWFDTMAKPIKVSVRIAPNCFYLTSNDVYDSDTGITKERRKNTGTIFVGDSVSVYMTAFHKKGKVISEADPKATYTVRLSNAAHSQYVEILGGTPISENAYLFTYDDINGSGFDIAAIDTPLRKSGKKYVPTSVKVTVIATCNQSGKNAKFTLTIKPEPNN